MRYWLQVFRDRNREFGPGKLLVMCDEESIAEFECITGGKERNPKKYGGLTPPIEWTVTEKIEHRDHPAHIRGAMSMARIYPAYEPDMQDYSERTFDLEGSRAFPFMIHAGSPRVGSSTGCVAITYDWHKAKDAINNAYDECEKEGVPLILEVFDR